MFIPALFAAKERWKESDWVGETSDHSTAKAEDEDAMTIIKYLMITKSMKFHGNTRENRIKEQVGF